MKSQYVELLAPAANIEVGRAAIDAGADAVYIGGPAFGARNAAANSMADIEALCKYAHLFGVRIFLTLNTRIYADELAQAVGIAFDAYNAGVDALIVQDFSLLDAALPPIPLHASTQCFNFEAQKVVALQNAGFERVVLERGLSIDEIRAIRAATDVELEMFIHGAICVGYSGRCNLSEQLTGRSGNRGQCAQPCRSRYDLVDATGRVLVANEALLSPLDLNLSARIGEIVDAGVSSLKIEGRLKDASYVANVVAHYNNILVDLGVRRPSFGRSVANFTPDVALSFNRGFTEWFFDGAATSVNSVGVVGGKYLGKVKSVGANFFVLDSEERLDNGDGVAFLDSNGNSIGVRINRVEEGKNFPLTMAGIAVGVKIFQTSATKFAPKSKRVIDVDVEFSQTHITATDAYGAFASVELPSDLELAKNSQKAAQNIENSLRKSGDTIFEVQRVTISTTKTPFLPTSQLNAIRRELFAKLAFSRVERKDMKSRQPILPSEDSDYLLRTRYCILRERGLCLKSKQNFTMPLHLVNNGKKIGLQFMCDTCQMQLVQQKR